MLSKVCYLQGVIFLFFIQITSAQNSSPLQNRVVTTSYNLVYDSKAWAFNAGAPVRSTALIKNGAVYFGTAKGVFFAINKKTAQVKWKFQTGYAIHSSASTLLNLFFSSIGPIGWDTARHSNAERQWQADP